jgi:hypothetical protein
MYKTNFVRVTEQGVTSLHDEYPLVQSRDIVLRFEVSQDGKPMNAQVCPNGKFQVMPVFTLKATDPMASSYVQHWAEMAELNGVEQSKVISAKSTAEAMKRWK